MTKLLQQSSVPGQLDEIDVVISGDQKWSTPEWKLSEDRTIPTGCFLFCPVAFEPNGYVLTIEAGGILAMDRS